MSGNTIRGIKLPDIRSDLDVRIGGQTLNDSNTPMIYDGIGWTVRGYNLHTENGVVIFLDVLGMKGIWHRLQPNDVVNRWNKVIRVFMDKLEERPPKGGHFFRILSDTIIITIPTKLNESAIIEAFDLLLQPFIESLKLRMLLRGTISYGTYYLSERLIIGEALDDAAYHHDKFDWTGIALSPTVSENQVINTRNRSKDRSCIFIKSVPHKNTQYDTLVLNWPMFDNDRECYSILKQEEQRGLDPKKYSNTFTFYESVIKIA